MTFYHNSGGKIISSQLRPEKKSKIASQLIEEGVACQSAGDFVEAETRFRGALRIDPDSADAYYMIGLILYQKGEKIQAQEYLYQAFKIQPDSIEIISNLALLLASNGDFLESIRIFRKGLKIEPDDSQLLNGLGVQLRAVGKLDEAEDNFRKAIKVGGDDIGPWYNLANLFLARGDCEGAHQLYKKALSHDPNNVEVMINLAIALSQLDQLSEAETLLKGLLQKSPDHIAILNNLGNLCRELGKRDSAADYFKRALHITPNHPDVLYNYGQLLADDNEFSDARKHFGLAIKIKYNFTKAFWAERLTLPVIYHSEEQIIEESERWKRGLRDVVEKIQLKTQVEISAGLETISEITNFFLPYQGLESRKEQEIYGNLVTRIANASFPGYSPSSIPQVPPRGKKRIVFISCHFRSHTIFHLFSAWLTELPRAKFEVHALSVGQHQSRESNQLKASSVDVHINYKSLNSQVKWLARLKPDVIIFTDIGMDPTTQVLAGLRFAPLQCLAWGHPITSGFPGIDKFFSSKLMELPGSKAHYSEELVCLPHLSINYQRPREGSRERLFDRSAIFFCPQSLFKIPPSQDRYFARLLIEVPKASLQLIAHDNQNVTNAFVTRISAVFSAHGISFSDRVKIYPRLNRQKFLKLYDECTLVLDSFKWSGGNTNLEALAAGVPVVTLPGTLMRSRHAFAMLTILNLPDLIAKDEEEWLRIAIEIAQNHSLRKAIEKQIEEMSSRLFGNNSWLTSFISHTQIG